MFCSRSLGNRDQNVVGGPHSMFCSRSLGNRDQNVVGGPHSISKQSEHDHDHSLYSCSFAETARKLCTDEDYVGP